MRKSKDRERNTIDIKQDQWLAFQLIFFINWSLFFRPWKYAGCPKRKFQPNQLDLPLLPNYPVGDEGSWHFSLFKMPFLGIPHYSYQL